MLYQEPSLGKVGPHIKVALLGRLVNLSEAPYMCEGRTYRTLEPCGIFTSRFLATFLWGHVE